MSRKNLIISLIVLVIVAGIAFWGGIQYQSGQVPARGSYGQFAAGGTGSSTFRGGAGGTRAATTATVGQIITEGQGNITVQLSNGNSQIVLISTSTQVLKETSVSQSDLATGTNVIVAGTSNSDGSISASMIQIRPAGTSGFGGAGVSSSQAPMIPAGSQ